MKVQAIDVGYYEHILRKKGDVFDLHDSKLFSKRWMKSLEVQVEAPAPAPVAQKGAKASKKAKEVAVPKEEQTVSSGDEDVI